MNSNSESKNYSLFTDLYAWTMAQSWFDNEMHLIRANYVCYFRKLPSYSDYVVFNGLENIIEFINNYDFKAVSAQLANLSKQSGVKFSRKFINFLENYSIKKSNLNLKSVEEGEIIFPNEPAIIIEGPIFLIQIFEAYILNSVDFASRVTTKSSLISSSLNWSKPWLEFGARRAQGVDSAMVASRAAYLAGASATSNSLASVDFNIPSSGTLGHSFIMSFDSEEKAFNAFSESFKENCILLVDTYEIEKSLNYLKAIQSKLKEINQNIKAVRIDSGDLNETSKMIRKFLDDNNMKDTKIIATGELDETQIQSLLENNAPIDIFGVGTKLFEDKELGFIYKLSAVNENNSWTAKNKTSINEPEKSTLKGRAEFLRYYNNEGEPSYDLIYNSDKEILDKPIGLTKKEMYKVIFNSGELQYSNRELNFTREKIKSSLQNFKFENYKVLFDKNYQD